MAARLCEDRRMDLDAFRWLLTDDGQALLGRAAEAAPADPLRAQTAAAPRGRRPSTSPPR